MQKLRVIVVGDERSTFEISRGLLDAGFAVTTATVDDAYASAQCCHPDLAILDLELMASTGFELCRKLRDDPETQNVGIMTLSDGDADDEDRELRGFYCGIDDYIAQPFEMRQLVHRANILIKRRQAEARQSFDVIRWGNVELHFGHRIARLNGAELTLTETEFLLLWALLLEPGRVVARRELLDVSRGIDSDTEERTIDVHIRALRRKLEKDVNMIDTVRGLGYRFSLDAVPTKAASDHSRNGEFDKRPAAVAEYAAIARV